MENYWYRITPLHVLLYPLSLLFGALAALRRALYRCGLLRRVRLPAPVIVVGNISVGGTGKTPLTLALAQHLIERGWHPLIVSRGHKGNNARPRRIAADSEARLAGDEPLLMARRGLCPVWTGKDRAAAALAGLRAEPLCDIVLCDDGLQHYRLQRDVEIAVVDGVRRFGNGLLLPAGPLRETPARLRSVDAVVVNGGEAASGEYGMRLAGERFQNLLDPALSVGAGALRGLRCHAVAGIGNPRRYFDQLASLGLSVIEHPFPDHHPYRAGELDFADCDAILLTEKDAVKCAAFADARYWMLRVDALIDPALTAHLLRKISPHGR